MMHGYIESATRLALRRSWHHEFVERFRGPRVCHVDFAVSLSEVGLSVVSETIGGQDGS
jgi:hypothetical protein